MKASLRLIILFCLSLSSVSFAFNITDMFNEGRGTDELKLMSSKTVEVGVKVDPVNLKLSQADYSRPVVKILIPELADHTLLDHRNTNEGAPCMATYETELPSDVIANSSGIDQVQIQIETFKRATIYEKKTGQECYIEMLEVIKTKIRGKNFLHVESQVMPKRDLADCR